MDRIREERQNSDESRRALARGFGVDPNQPRNWQGKFDDPNKKKSTLTHINPRASSLHTGGKSSLGDIEHDVLRNIYEHREQDIPVSVRLVVESAKGLDAAFRAKTAKTQDESLFCPLYCLLHMALSIVSSLTNLREVLT
jgi:transposase-like protein